MSVAAQTARVRHHVPTLTRAALTADIFPISILDVPVLWQKSLGSPDSAQSRQPLAHSAVKADRLSGMELKRLVRQRGWDATAGGSIVLSGKGRTTEAIRKEVIAKLLEAHSKEDSAAGAGPPIKITEDGKVYGVSSNLTPWESAGWESPNVAPQEATCKLIAEVLQKLSRQNAAKNTKLSKWGRFDVELARCFSFRGDLVGDRPCISVLVSHKASPPPELNLAEICSADSPERVIGLEVRTLPKHSIGVIAGCAGPLEENRKELAGLTKCDRMRDLILKASGSEACWKVQLHGRRGPTFTYIASQLQPLLTFGNMEALDRMMGYTVNSSLASDSILKPNERQRLVDAELDRLHKVAPDIAARLFPSPPARVSSDVLTKDFVTFDTPKIVVGGDTKVQATRGGEIWAALQKHGLYRYESSIGKDLRLCGCVLGKSPTKADVMRAQGTFKKMTAILGQLGITVDTGTTSVKATKSVKAAMDHAAAEGAQAMVVFSASGSENMYYSIKQQCLKQSAPGLSHLASQWIDLKRSDHQKPALLNMAVQLCAKVGHTPYVSDCEPSIGDDPVLCGVDVCHLRNRAGHMEHVIAGLQIRRGNGEVEHSWVCQGKIKGESIPASVWKSVVSKEACAGRHVVIHRDGRFTETEKEFLRQHAEDIGAAGAFGMVEIVKHAAGTPRLYEGDSNAPSGSFLRLSDTEGILTSGTCRTGTRNPLLVRVVSGTRGKAPVLPVEVAAEDIFRLSWLSYGTLYNQPRLPVTTKTADKAAYFHASADVAQPSCSDGGDEFALMNHGRQQYWL